MERLPLFERKIVNNVAEQRLSAVNQAEKFHFDHEPEPGFMTGLAGEAILFYTYGRAFGLPRFENLGFLALERMLGMINAGFNWPSFAAGLAGIRFTLKFLASRGFISESDGSALDPTEPCLQNFADERFKTGDYDFLHGGLGMCLTETRDTRHETRDTIRETRYASRVTRHDFVASLASLAFSPAPGQLAWPSRHPQTGTPEINLGLAHGVPSVLLALSRHADDPVAREMVEQGVSYLLSCRMENTANGSLFPHRMVGGKPDQPGRLAWCYGDPGVGAALWQIGVNCNRPDWVADSIGILRRAASRRDTTLNRVNDACLCHGTAGLALLFYKMAFLTNHEEFLDAADHWARATLDHGLNEAGAGGYLFQTTGNRFVSGYSLLEGIAGVGLTLLALLDADTLGWEQGLLI